MKRIIIHWTGGPNKPTGLDRQHYHKIIDGDGQIHDGQFPISANAGKLVKGAYAAHTLNCNTGSIGVALAAMAGAQESPFKAGAAPVTPAQEKALTALLVKLCDQYQIPVTRETVLTHAEVQPTLGIAQKGKWDIRWLPGMVQIGDAVTIGDGLRARVQAAIDARMAQEREASVPASSPGWLAAILTLVAKLWRRK